MLLTSYPVDASNIFILFLASPNLRRACATSSSGPFKVSANSSPALNSSVHDKLSVQCSIKPVLLFLYTQL